MRSSPPEPTSQGSVFASFAVDVDPGLRAVLKRAEVLGIRGRSDDGLDVVEAAVAEFGERATDDDWIAIAEMTAVLRLVGADDERSLAILRRSADEAFDPRARGAILLNQARSQGHRPGGQELCAEALAEFTAAGDLRGQAITLVRMALISIASPREHRLRLAHESIAVAEHLQDPWTTAACVGQAALLQTYLGESTSLEMWDRSVSVPTDLADTLAAQVLALNYVNRLTCMLGLGHYDQAARQLEEGRISSRGAAWLARWGVIEALLHYRYGRLDQAADALDAPAIREHPYPASLRTAIRAAVGYERDRQLTSTELAAALPIITSVSEQFACFAAGTLAQLRYAAHEPNPTREARDLLRQIRERDYRFGWEDALLGIALVDTTQAAEELDRMAGLWLDCPRAHAIRAFVEGLVAGAKGYDLLIEAAGRLRSLPEPVTAGRALHAAARVAPTVAIGNVLRRQAIVLFEEAGADRSLAAVVRDRTLPRGAGHVPVPESQANKVSAGLTPREREVALLAARGLTASEIAGELNVSLGTARNYLMRVRTKFGGIPKRQLARALGLDE